MDWDGQGGPGSAGGPANFWIPPLPQGPPPAPPNAWRAAAVALLNLTGLGLGYAVLRRWLAMVACWIATGILLLVALPADADGVPDALLICYLIALAIAAAHGARRGLRGNLALPLGPPITFGLALVLLAVPVGGAIAYDGAHDEAVEKMLLARAAEADRLVKQSKGKAFAGVESTYRQALATYQDLRAHFPHSRAGRAIPQKLQTYYETVGASYAEKDYCIAIDPLKFLRTTPPRILGAKSLGKLASWPDDRLATSLYECGVTNLGSGEADAAKGGDLGQLLTDFPHSTQAGRVVPAVNDRIDQLAKDLKGDDPCAANDLLRAVATQVAALPGERAGVADALSTAAGSAKKRVQSGTYACGVDQYHDKDFNAALETMNNFLRDYSRDGNRARAQKIAIAAEIAGELPAAGKRLPGASSSGGISVTVSNDSPREVEVLYTGPVAGKFTLRGCGSCSTYSSDSEGRANACDDSGTRYPKKTIHLAPGTTYFLHKPKGGSAKVGTDTVQIRSGFIYTECAFVVESLGSPGLDIPGLPSLPRPSLPPLPIPSVSPFVPKR